MISESLGSVVISTLAWNVTGAGSNPAVGAIFHHQHDVHRAIVLLTQFNPEYRLLIIIEGSFHLVRAFTTLFIIHNDYAICVIVLRFDPHSSQTNYLEVRLAKPSLVLSKRGQAMVCLVSE